MCDVGWSFKRVSPHDLFGSFLARDVCFNSAGALHRLALNSNRGFYHVGTFKFIVFLPKNYSEPNQLTFK